MLKLKSSLFVFCSTSIVIFDGMCDHLAQWTMELELMFLCLSSCMHVYSELFLLYLGGSVLLSSFFNIKEYRGRYRIFGKGVRSECITKGEAMSSKVSKECDG